MKEFLKNQKEASSNSKELEIDLETLDEKMDLEKEQEKYSQEVLGNQNLHSYFEEEKEKECFSVNQNLRCFQKKIRYDRQILWRKMQMNCSKLLNLIHSLLLVYYWREQLKKIAASEVDFEHFLFVLDADFVLNIINMIDNTSRLTSF